MRNEELTPREYWTAYVERQGGVKPTAERLNSPYQTIASITSGHRGIGASLARRFAEQDASLDPNVLIWVQADRNAVA